MDVSEIIAELKQLGDSRAIKVWERMNMDTSNYLGVGLTKIKKLGKRIKKNHELSEKLWQTGIRDAMLLSFIIADPKQLTKDDLNNKIEKTDFWDLSDTFCQSVVAKSPFGVELAGEWRHSDSEMIKRSAFVTISEIAKKDKNISDELLLDYLNQISDEIKNAKNWVKEAMIIAVMSIGVKNPSLYEKALKTAESYGEIIVDYGETSCVTPNALKYLSGDKAKLKAGII